MNLIKLNKSKKYNYLIFYYFTDIINEFDNEKIIHITSTLLNKIDESKENFNILLELLLLITYLLNIKYINSLEKKKCYIILYELYKKFSDITIYYLSHITFSNFNSLKSIDEYLFNCIINNEIDIFKIDIYVNKLFVGEIEKNLSIKKEEIYFLEDDNIKYINNNKRLSKKLFKQILLHNIGENEYKKLINMNHIIVNDYISTNFNILNCLDYNFENI